MKNLYIFLILILTSFMSPVCAKNVKVVALSDFCTVNPPESFSVKIVSDFTTESGLSIPANSILNGDVIKVKNPKRLKRNATFSVILTEYTEPDSDNIVKLNQNIIGKYTALTDVTASSIARKGAAVAGNKLLNLYVGPGLAMVKGAVKNEDGNVAKSAIKSAYKSSPISLVEKGKHIELKAGDSFVMNFKVKGMNEEASDDSETEDKTLIDNDEDVLD